MCNQSSTLIHSQLISQTGGLAQLARAPALQAGGQRFESVILHYAFLGKKIFDILTQAKL